MQNLSLHDARQIAISENPDLAILILASIGDDLIYLHAEGGLLATTGYPPGGLIGNGVRAVLRNPDTVTRPALATITERMGRTVEMDTPSGCISSRYVPWPDPVTGIVHCLVIIHRLNRPQTGRNYLARHLTERQLDILRLVAHGCSNQEIAIRLCISVPTVKYHVKNIFKLLQVSNRTEAGRVYLSFGIG